MALAPAINFESILVAQYWPQLVMKRLGVYPSPREFEAITAAATAACDEVDGVADGIIATPDLCDFNPLTVVGQAINYSHTGTQTTISAEAATIALATWTGPRSVEGKFRWYGLNKDAPLTTLAGTNCNPHGTCSAVPPEGASAWITHFVQKNPNFAIANMSPRQYDTIFRQSVNQYTSILGTNDPDLTDFRDAGGKMITWHGLADPVVFPNGTYEYYQQVLEVDPNAADYYRFFPAPGLGHCAGGVGWFPASSLQSLVDWVENDVVPETLEGTTLPDANGTARRAPLCPYPLVLEYIGGDINAASSFQCQQSF